MFFEGVEGGKVKIKERGNRYLFKNIIRPIKAPVMAPPQGLQVKGQLPPAHFNPQPIPEPISAPIIMAKIIFKIITSHLCNFK